MFSVFIETEQRVSATVWKVIGHSIMNWAGRYVELPGWGPDLGLEDQLQLEWSGWRGMKWSLLLSTVRKEMHAEGHPHTIVIHLGENDLSGEKGLVLSMNMRQEKQTMYWGLPETGVLVMLIVT